MPVIWLILKNTQNTCVISLSIRKQVTKLVAYFDDTNRLFVSDVFRIPQDKLSLCTSIYLNGLRWWGYASMCNMFGLNANVNITLAFQHFKFPWYELHHRFRLDGGVCAFILNSASFSRIHALEAQKKDNLCL